MNPPHQHSIWLTCGSPLPRLIRCQSSCELGDSDDSYDPYDPYDQASRQIRPAHSESGNTSLSPSDGRWILVCETPTHRSGNLDRDLSFLACSLLGIGFQARSDGDKHESGGERGSSGGEQEGSAQQTKRPATPWFAAYR